MVKVCPVCGKEFEAKRKNKIYCSKECYLKKRHEEYRKQYPKKRYPNYPKPSQEVMRVRNKIYRRFRKVRPKYPCYRFHESRVARIPDKMCLNCSAPECRFEND